MVRIMSREPLIKKWNNGGCSRRLWHDYVCHSVQGEGGTESRIDRKRLVPACAGMTSSMVVWDMTRQFPAGGAF